MKHKILMRWVAGYLLAVGFVALFMVIYINPELESIFRGRFETMRKKDSTLIKKIVESHDFDLTSFNETDLLADKIGAILDVQVTFISSDGRVLGDKKTDLVDLIATENQSNQPVIIAARRGGFGKIYSQNSTLELAHIVSFNGKSDAQRGFVRLSIPTTEINEALFEIHYMFWLAGILGLILVLLIGYWISRSFSIRVAAMTQSVRDLHSVVPDQMNGKKGL